MDTLNDHAARISARIEEYRTLDLIGRNSADDLQHHLRALVAERDEANARAARLADAVRHHCEHRALEIARRQNLTGPEIKQLATDLASGAGLHDGDLDAAPGDTAGER